jgi:hypothetical protein
MHTSQISQTIILLLETSLFHQKGATKNYHTSKITAIYQQVKISTIGTSLIGTIHSNHFFD